MATENAVDKSKQLDSIFFAYSQKEYQRLKQGDLRFVHYTSAAVARSILEKRQIWMRNARTMNDFSEIEHGHECLRSALASDGRRLHELLVEVGKGAITKELFNRLDAGLSPLLAKTYLTCFSEHLKGPEDRLGRLSMWRAYGGDSGVALVIDGEHLLNELWQLNVFLSPVLYADEYGFREHFVQLVAHAEREKKLLSEVPDALLLTSMLRAFQFAAVSTKHPGFAEEREWRLVYAPELGANAALSFEIENVRGIPQEVIKLPMELPERGLVLSKHLERVIIGPTNYPHVVVQSFGRLMNALGIQRLTDRLVVSNIPLRQP